MNHYTGSVPDTARRTNWRDEARCGAPGTDPDVFFATDDDSIEDAKAECRMCPVADACLEYAFAARIYDGVFGGLTGRQRRRLTRRANEPADVAEEPEEPAEPPRLETLHDAFAARTKQRDDGHLAWTGKQQFSHRGKVYTARRAAFAVSRDRDPVGQVMTSCEVADCVLPAHLTDAQERAALVKPLPRPQERRLAECGTRSAYQRHVKRGEPVDEACRAANRRAWADYRRRKGAAA
jgi:hypothetical protein